MLKKRGEDLVTIDDEPLNGPDMYFCIDAASDVSIFKGLEACQLPLKAVLQAKASADPHHSLDSFREQYIALGAAGKDDTAFRRTAWIPIIVGEGFLATPEDVCNGMACAIYQALDEDTRRLNYVRSLALTHIPETGTEPDMRLYRRLLHGVPLVHQTPAVLLDCLLAQVVSTIETADSRVPHSSSVIVRPEPSHLLTPFLNQAFTNMAYGSAQEIRLDGDDACEGGDVGGIAGPIVLRYGDTTAASLYHLKSEDSGVEEDADEYSAFAGERRVYAACRTAELHEFLKGIPPLSTELAAVVLQQLAFQAQLTSRSLAIFVTQHSLYDVVLREAFCNVGAEYFYTLSNTWLCREVFDRPTFVQVLGGVLADDTVSLFTKYDPSSDALLLVLAWQTDPNKAGIQNSTWTANLRSCMGLSNFQMLPTEEVADVCAGKAHSQAYALGDRLCRFRGSNSTLLCPHGGMVSTRLYELDQGLFVKPVVVTQRTITLGGNTLVLHLRDNIPDHFSVLLADQTRIFISNSQMCVLRGVDETPVEPLIADVAPVPEPVRPPTAKVFSAKKNPVDKGSSTNARSASKMEEPAFVPPVSVEDVSLPPPPVEPQLDATVVIPSGMSVVFSTTQPLTLSALAGSGPHDGESGRSGITELSRSLLSDGTVLKYLVSGVVVVMSPNGTLAERDLNGSWHTSTMDKKQVNSICGWMRVGSM